MYKPQTLRHYQRQAVDAVKSAWCANQNPLIALATGAGKTTIMSQLLVETFDPQRQRALMIGHTKEIIEQIHNRVENQFAGRLNQWFGGHRMYPGLGIVMGSEDVPMARLVVATRQSLHDKRLDEILSYGAFDFVLIDEAHHAVADNTYGQIIDRLKQANPQVRIAGVTATPKRTDDKALATLFDDIVYEWLIPDGIEAGYLVPVTRVKVQTRVDLSNVKSSRGDYSQKRMVSILDTSNWVELVQMAYERYIRNQNRPCLAYLPSVEMSQQFAHALQNAGIRARHIDGTTPKHEREYILNAYQNGEIECVSNMAVLTEGFDAPATSAILLARPTRSQTLFTQIVGRGLRPCPDKKDCLLLDMTVVDTKALTFGTLLGDMLTCEACGVEYFKGFPACSHCGAIPAPKPVLLDEEKADEIVTTVQSNIVGQELIEVFEQLFPEGRAAWYHGEDGYISCMLSFDSGSLVIIPPLTDPLYRLVRVPKSKDEPIVLEYQNLDVRFCLIVGEQLVKRQAHDASLKDASWRSDPASVGQVALLQKFGIQNVQGMTKGLAGQIITHHIAVQRVQDANSFHIG